MGRLGPAVDAARSACRWATGLVPRGRPGVTILAYHLVGAGTDSPVDLPAETFRRQMGQLRDSAAELVPLSRVVAALERGVPLERDQVAITFDDAYRNFVDQALPILEGLGLPATLFVPTDFLDGRAPGPLSGAEELPPVPWNRLREMVHDGLVALGSHSRSHPDLRSLVEEDLGRELRGSADVIEERTRVRPESFCYPRGLWSRRLERAVAREYRCAVVGGGRKNRPGRTRPQRLQRVSIRRDMPASLEPILGAGTVLEEWLANQVRLLRR